MKEHTILLLNLTRVSGAQNCPAHPGEGTYLTCLTPAGFMRLLYALLLLYTGYFLAPSPATAQLIAPVQVQAYAPPPYSHYLSEYASPTSERLRVSLLLLDVNKAGLEVGLRIRLSAPGISIATDPAYRGTPYYLDAGLNLILEGSDLAEYFDPAHLVLQGIDQRHFLRNGTQLPEAYYQLSIEVYEYDRPGKLLNRPNFISLWIQQGDPPLLNQPQCGIDLTINEHLPEVFFSWSPMGATAGIQTYLFELFEVLPIGANPEQVARSSIPLHQEEVMGTLLRYDLTKPSLFTDQQYCWRVRAIDPTGQVVYKNDGYSTVCSFRVVSPEEEQRPEIKDLYAQGLSPTLGEVVWTESDGEGTPEQGDRRLEEGEGAAYRVAYRKAGDNKNKFVEEEVSSERHVLRNLEVSTVYEVRVARKQADGSYGPYSSSALFQTLSAKAQQCVAEAVETTQELASMSQKALLKLQTGDRFLAGGGMEVTVVNAQGGNGVFSGTGVVLIPWLGTRLEVVFQEVIINQDKQLVGGAVELRSDSNVKELLAKIDKNTQKKEPPPPPPPTGSEPIALTGTIAQVSVDQEAKQVSVQLAGQTEPVLVSYAEGPVTIQDEAGNRYVVNEQGEVSQEAGAVAGGTSETGSSTESATNYTLMLSILAELEEAINDWLAIEGKGPLDQAEIQSLASLPAGLPADALLLTHLSEHIFDRVEEAPRAFFQAIEASNPPAASLLAEDSAALSEEELAQAKQAVALQLTAWGLIADLETFLDELGLKGVCVGQGLTKGKAVFWQRIGEDFAVEKAIVLAMNAGTVETLFCLSSRENCPGQDYWGQFSCGVVSALVEEIDLNGMMDAGMAAAKAYLRNQIDCILEGSGIVVVLGSDNASEALRNINRCFFGVDLGAEEMQQLYTSMKSYVATHYDDPYDQGKATWFVLSILSPFGKVSKATKLKALTKLEQLGSKVDNVLSAFRKGVDAQDIDEIHFAIGAAARGSVDGLSAKSKQLLDSWPIDTHNKFYDEVVDTELWGQAFRNAADQDGLVKAWKVLDDAGIDDITKKNIDFLKRFNEFEIPTASLNHANVGDFTYIPGTNTVSKMKGGGHGPSNIQFLDRNNIEYNIVNEFDNGVRVGNVPGHKSKPKRTGTGQSWFPDSWSADDISNAGKYVSSLSENLNVSDGFTIFGTFKGVKVGVIKTNGKVGTIFPDSIQP